VNKTEISRTTSLMTI